MSINVVVDISHHNGNVDLGKAQAAGIVGVIHKATQGTSMADNMYEQNRQKAKAAGLLWGAYHFGTNADGAAQANFFLSKVNADDRTLLVLDYEPNGNSTMTLDQARAFVSRIKDCHRQVSRFLFRFANQTATRRPACGPRTVAVFSMDRAIRPRADAHSGDLAGVDHVAIHRRQRWSAAALGGRHRQLRSRSVQRNYRAVAAALGRGH